MKIYDKQLKKAYTLLSRKKYGKLIAFLEKKITLYRDDYLYHYFLGSACLFNGDKSGADTYLKRAIQVNRRAVEPRLLLAVLALQKMDSTEAVRLWLGILDINSSCKQAQRGLEKIRKIPDSESLDAFMARGRFNAFLPRIKAPFPGWTTGLILLLALLTVLLYVSGDLVHFNVEKENTFRRSEEAGILIDIGDGAMTGPGKQGQAFQFNDKQIRSIMKTARGFFEDYQDNRAQVELNRILYSNASEPVKQKARILEASLKEPDFTNFVNTFSYSEVKANPLLYNRCYIRWKGRLSNISMNDPGMSFDFLAGYETGEVLEGIIKVYSEFQVRLDSALPLEILGQIEAENKEVFTIRILSLRNILDS